MDIQINSKVFVAFLTKCRVGGLIKDLILNASGGNIWARVSPNDASFYGEVYEPNVKIIAEGNIKIPSIDKILAVLSRTSAEVIKIASADGVFAITDGNAQGKMKTKLFELGDAEFVESFQRIKDKPDLFNKEKLEYVSGKYKYENGIEVSYEMLQTLLKDAKAFGFELYRFEDVKIKDQNIVACIIEDIATKERFQRNLEVVSKIGNSFQKITVGAGFREMVSSLDKEQGDKGKISVKLYFSPSTILITNNSTYFFNLHAVVD